MQLLGINSYSNNAGIALLDDGRILRVQEEERFNGKKKTDDFPHGALSDLAPEGFDGTALEAICFPWDPKRFLWTFSKALFAHFPSSLQLLRAESSAEDNSMLAFKAWFDLRKSAARHIRGATPAVRWVRHHDAHAAVAFYGSPFEDALVLVADAFGDSCSITAYEGKGNRLEQIYANKLMNSLGVLYSCVTLYLGYKTVHDEGKVMALASLGNDEFVEQFRNLFRFESGGDVKLDFSWINFQRAGEIRPFTGKFEKAFGPPRKPGEELLQTHMNLARALQVMTEEALLHLAGGLKEKTGARNLAYAGGVALNCVAAGRLAREARLRRRLHPPVPGRRRGATRSGTVDALHDQWPTTRRADHPCVLRPGVHRDPDPDRDRRPRAPYRHPRAGGGGGAAGRR